MPTIDDTEVMKELNNLAVQAGKGISNLVNQTMSDESHGKIRWTPDRFIALEMGYTVAFLQRLCEGTTEVVTKATAEIMMRGMKDIPPDVENLLKEILEKRN